MSTILQFRCTNENCPGNYQLTAISKEMESQLNQMNAFAGAPSTANCLRCGSPGLVDVKYTFPTKKQAKQHDKMLEDTLRKMRESAAMMKDLLAKKMAAGGLG